MITKHLKHLITNRELEHPLIVESMEDNEHWITLRNGDEEFHLPIIVVNELIEALEDHKSILR
jgi:hypothetical protein